MPHQCEYRPALDPKSNEKDLRKAEPLSVTGAPVHWLLISEGGRGTRAEQVKQAKQAKKAKHWFVGTSQWIRRGARRRGRMAVILPEHSFICSLN